MVAFVRIVLFVSIGEFLLDSAPPLLQIKVGRGSSETLVKVFPPEYQQPTKEQTSEVSKVCHVVSREVGNTCKELDNSIDDYEYACPYRKRNGENEEASVRKEPAKSKEYTEDSSTGTDGKRCYGCASVHEPPYELLNKSGTNTGYEVIYKKALASPLLFKRCCKHKDGKHIEEQVGEA